VAKTRLAGLLLAVLVAGAAMAADPPTPKVMNDAPANEGKWKMEMMQMPGADKAEAAGMSGMMVCTTAGKAMAGRAEDKSMKDNCQFKMVEDTSSRAVMEMTCPGNDTALRTTITKVAAKTYEMTAQNLKKPEDKPIRMRMSYVGPCSANESVMSYDKDSKVCQQMRTQLPQIEKARADCAKGGANGASCAQMLDRQISQIKSMCGQ
jgi:Protein of unknown function (DUF3617)